MELELVISIVSLCGFAAALSYNVYEFRKVGKALDEGRKEHRGMMEVQREMMETQREIIQALNGINERMTEAQREMVRALGRINESLVILAKSLGAKGRKAKQR